MYLHPTSRRILTTLSKDLPQSLMLTGPEGIGFFGAIKILQQERELLMIKPEKKQGDKRYLDDDGAILIDTIRDLRELLRSTGQSRLVIIDKADSMTTGAQNAFLKLLEEPNASTHFVLLAHQPRTLLPTILSRVQTVDLKPVSKDDSEKILDALKITDARERQQLLFIAEGLPGLLSKLASDRKLFTQRADIIRDARTLLTGRDYDKAVIANKYKDKRPEAITLLRDCLKLLKISGSFDKMDAVLEAIRRLEQNGAIRLQLLAILW